MKVSTAHVFHPRARTLALAVALVLVPPTAVLAVDAEVDADTTLQYELRPGDDPSQVARLFRIPVEELLRRNGIRDASRMPVGTVLDIPDPRAVVVQELRAEQERLRASVQELRDAVGVQQARVADLEGQLQRTAAERDELSSRLTFYGVTKVIAGIALCAVLALAGALLLALARLRDEVGRRVATLKHAESLRSAVERYRGLGGQLELKYHNLYRQAQTDASTEAALHAMRTAYDADRSVLEAQIADSEAALSDLDKPAPRRRRHHKAA